TSGMRSSRSQKLPKAECIVNGSGRSKIARLTGSRTGSLRSAPGDKRTSRLSPSPILIPILMPLRLNTLRVNTIANFAGQIWAFVLWLIVTPFYLRIVGAEGYGLIGFFIVLQAAIAVLDLGMSGTLNRQMARGAAGTLEPAAMANLVRCLQWVYGPLCVLIGIVLTAGSRWIANRWLQAPASADPHLDRAVQLMEIGRANV